MSHRTGPAAFNNQVSTYTKEIIEQLMLNLAAHPMVIDPPIYDADGDPVRITKFRNFDGIEVVNLGKSLTLSIFPFSFVKTDEDPLTVNSTNASVVYHNYTIGNGGSHMGPKDQAVCNIALKLHLFGYDPVFNIEPQMIPGQETVFEINQAEGLLQSWAELLRLILVDERMRRLPARTGPSRMLLTNSFVNYVNFGTGKWTEGANLVFHAATLLFQAIHYPTRKLFDEPIVQFIGGHVGSIPDPANPGQEIEVCYDLSTGRYFNCVTNATLSPQDLIDPGTGKLYDSLLTNALTLVDLVDRNRRDAVTMGDQP